MEWADRNPATRPSSMAMRGMTPRAEADGSTFREAVVGHVVGALLVLFMFSVLAFALTGCSSESDQMREVIREGRAIERRLRKTQTDPAWDARCAIYETDAARFLPEPAPSLSPAPKGE